MKRAFGAAFLLWMTISTADVRADACGTMLLARPAGWGASAGSEFRALAGRGLLLGQRDARLANRGLLKPGGGLCATTCAVNAMHALMSFGGYPVAGFAGSADLWVDDLVQFIGRRLHADARLGVTFSQLERALLDLTQAVRVDLRTSRGFRRGHATGADVQAGPDELILLSVFSRKGMAHALVVVGADPESGRIELADPNRPGEVIRTWVGEGTTPDGAAGLRIGWTGERPDAYAGFVDDVLRLRILPRRR